MIHPPTPQVCQEEGERVEKQSTSSVSVTQDIDSESFVGRNLLLKMGWERGIKLGKSGAADEGPIELFNQQDKGGIGLRREQVEGWEGREKNKRKSYEDIKASSLQVTRRRYDSR
jgi:hypothetical protein